MKVDLERRGREFVYRLFPESGDPEEGRREFRDSPVPFCLVNLQYRTVLPDAFTEMHPDLHAASIWHALRPVVGPRLELPFAVSSEFGEWMLKSHGVALVRAEDRQPPRRPPERVVPALLFSGGMDSMAAGVLMPAATHHLFLDRIARLRPGERGGALIDLARQRDACAAVKAAGRPVHITADDHERLYLPYPIWHSNMTVLAALSMADSLGLRTLDTGEVFDAKYFGGYHAGKAAGWKMRPEPPRSRPRPPGWGAARDGFGFLKAVGLGLADCVGGLSEVATAKIVAESRFRGKSYSCYYPSEEPFCLRCDKCFKKLLLRHIAEKTEVPRELFERFLAVPRLRAMFDAPYLDWHHVWFYLFQKIRCRHWFSRELQRQAREGPDLSALEKWYPKARGDMEPEYADEVQENIQKRVRTMTPADMERLETLEVPPLRAPLRSKDAPRPKTPGAPPPGGAARGPATIPPETKALFRLLQAKLLSGPAPRWGPYRLDDVFLRPSDPGVCLWLSRVRGEAATPGEAVIARLFRIGRPGDRFLARLGTLGLDFESSRPIGMDLLRPLILSLSGVFKQARKESA